MEEWRVKEKISYPHKDSFYMSIIIFTVFCLASFYFYYYI